MEKLKTDYTNGEPWLADYFNTTNERVNELIDGMGEAGIGDAPSDGNQYTRKDEAWSEVNTEGVKSTKLINSDGSAKSIQQMIDEGIIGGSQAATTDSVISTHETDPTTGEPKTLQQILEALEASSGLSIDESLDKTSKNPVQNKTLANILIFS